MPQQVRDPNPLFAPELATQGVNTTDGGDYGYDGAGRMTGDPYRGLTIRYNHLDLPREIDSPAGKIQITYDANGQKRLYHVEGRYTRRYAGPLTFEKKADEDNYVPEAAATGDGRLVYDAEHNEIYPEYHHKDHLGNVRVVFTDRNKDKFVEIIGAGNEVTQIMDFYPFGLQQQGEQMFGVSGLESSNRLDYNGKEMLGETGLIDYGARWYDAAVGRWNAVDPLAESYSPISSYAYVANNPIILVDPDGMSIRNSSSGVTLTGSDAQSYFRSLQNSAHLDQGSSGESAESPKEEGERSFVEAIQNFIAGEVYYDAASTLSGFSKQMGDELEDMGAELINNETTFTGVELTNSLLPEAIFKDIKLKIGDNYAVAKTITLIKRGEVNRLNRIMQLTLPGAVNTGNGGISGSNVVKVIGPFGARHVRYGPPGSSQSTDLGSAGRPTVIGYIDFSNGNAKRYNAVKSRMHNAIIRNYLQSQPPEMRERAEVWLKYHKLGGY